jgi:hypothetical protein
MTYPDPTTPAARTGAARLTIRIPVSVKTRALLLLLAALLMPAGRAGAAEFPLTRDLRNSLNPQINDSGQVAWEADGQVYLWDRLQIRKLSTGERSNFNPKMNRQGQVVWESWDGREGELFLWEGQAVRPLANPGIHDFGPEINGRGQVVWTGSQDGDAEIYFWDGVSVRRITHNQVPDSDPHLNDQGQVAWLEGDGRHTQVFLWDGSAAQQLSHSDLDAAGVQINERGQVLWVAGDSARTTVELWDGSTVRSLSDAHRNNHSARLNNLGQVAWVGGDRPDGLDSAVYLWDGARVTPLSTDTGEHTELQINDCGQVAWQGWIASGSTPQLYLWSSGRVVRLTTGERSSYNFELSDSGQVIWESAPAMKAAAPGAKPPAPSPADLDQEIFLWNGSRVLQLTNNTVDDNSPRLSPGGTAAWRSWDGRHFQIHVYSPDPPYALALEPPLVAGGEAGTGKITLSEPAPAGGAVLSLVSSSPTLVSVPGSVPVPAGAMTAVFPITTGRVTDGTSVPISASYAGVDQSSVLQVVPNRLASLRVDPDRIAGGLTAQGTATLLYPTTDTAARVTLTSDSPAATVPDSVIVPAGAASVTFPVFTTGAGAFTPVTLTGDWGGRPQTASLLVEPVVLADLSFNLPPICCVGLQGIVTLTGPAPPGGAVVTLISGTPGGLILPDSVTVPAGATTVSFPMSVPHGVSLGGYATDAIALYGGVSRVGILSVPYLEGRATVNNQPVP